MQVSELIRMANQMAHQFTAMALEDMQDAPMTRPTDRGGNHPLWIAGHLAFGEGLVQQVVRGVPNPVEHWAPLFKFGTQPTDDPSHYPAFGEVMAEFHELYEANMRLLDELGEEGLDRPIENPPPGFEDFFKTPAHVLFINALHTMNHRGQVADARRAAGRSPMFEPSAAVG